MSLLRIAILIGALAAAHVGISDALFHLRCPEPIQLGRGGTLALEEETRLWVSVEGRIADAPPLILAAGTDDSVSACIPLLAPDGDDLEAMVLTMTVGSARALRTLGGKARFEGIARPAAGGEALRLAAYARSVGIEPPRRILVIEAGKQPAELAGAAALGTCGVLVGLLAAWTLALQVRRSMAPRPDGEGDDPPYVLRDLVILPLPEDARDEVHTMVKEVWETTAEQKEVLP